MAPKPSMMPQKRLIGTAKPGKLVWTTTTPAKK